MSKTETEEEGELKSNDFILFVKLWLSKVESYFLGQQRWAAISDSIWTHSLSFFIVLFERDYPFLQFSAPRFFFLWSIIADLFLFNYYKQLIFSCLHLEIYKVYKATTIDNLTCVGEKLGAFDSMVVFVPSHLEGYEFNHREFSTLLPSKLGPSSLVSKKKKKVIVEKLYRTGCFFTCK